MILKQLNAIVKLNKNKIAIESSTNAITFGALYERSLYLSQYLIKILNGNDNNLKNTLVGLFFDKSIDALISILALLNSGFTFVLLDINFPVKKINSIINDLGLEIILTNNKNLACTAEILRSNNNSIKLYNISEISYRVPVQNVSYSDIDNIAYVLYSSGSEGNPKGIAQSYKNLIEQAKGYIAAFSIKNDDRLTFLSSLYHDAALMDIFSCILTGATLIIYDLNDSHIGNMMDKIEHDGISVYHSVPTLFRNLFKFVGEIKFNTLRLIISGGEKLLDSDIELVRSKYSAAVIGNLYGQSESSANSFKLFSGDHNEMNISIGKPIEGTKIFILDDNNKITQRYETGEVYIASENLFLGYINKPEKTKECLLQSRTHGNVFKTGDLGRLISNDEFEFVERKNRQIKYNGFLLCLDEIEKLLIKLNNIEKVAVKYWEEDKGLKNILCVYYVASEHIEKHHFIEYLSEFLPDYMIPSYFILMESLPLSGSGKIDYNQLLLPSDGNTKMYLSPSDVWDQELVTIYREVFQRKKNEIHLNSDFFNLGGDSLKATVLVNRIHQKYQKKISVKTIYANPVIKQMSFILRNTNIKHFIGIPKAKVKEYYPLASAQERLFFIYTLNKESLVYNLPYINYVSGKIDIKRLEDSFRSVIQRHESLRTSFKLVNNLPVQVVSEKIDFDLEIITADLKEVNQKIESFIRPFDLSTGSLIRGGVISISEERNILIIDIHHIVTDGYSQTILVNDLIAFYNNIPLAEIKVTYKDYAEWQLSATYRQAMNGQREFWQRVYSDVPDSLALPYDFSKQNSIFFNGNRVGAYLDGNQYEIIKNLASGPTSIFMVLFSIFNIFLSKISNQTDIVVGIPVAGRNHREVEGLVGLFVNMLPVRTFLSPDIRFLQLLKSITSNILQCVDNQEYQYDKLIKDLRINRNSIKNVLFNVAFVYQNFNLNLSQLTDLKFEPYNYAQKTSKFDLSLIAKEIDEKALYFEFEYSTDLFKEETILRFITYFKQVISTITCNKEIKLSDIDIVSKNEKRKLLHDFNKTDASFPKDKTIIHIFQDQVLKNPQNIALCINNQQISYAQLNHRSNNVVRLLNKHGIENKSLIGILTKRSLNTIISIIGVLKTGSAYLPLDHEQPINRIKFIIKDSNIDFTLITDQTKYFSTKICNCLNIDEIDHNQYHLEPTIKINSQDNAYIIYTSGTTGRPKGVLITHLNLIRLFVNSKNPFDFTKNDVWTLSHSYCFDFSVWEIFGALLFGSKLVIVPKHYILDIKKFYELLVREGVSVLNQTPSAFYILLYYIEAQLKKLLSLRYIIFGGEALSPSNLKKWYLKYPNTKLINMYGITETTVHVTYKEISLDEIEKNVSNVGIPLPTTQVLILDKYMKLSPIGCIGEIYVGGLGVGKGYINQNEMNLNSFVYNPYFKNLLLYKSGDLGRRLPNGEIEYIGRNDSQIELRGYRIEIGEIEKQISSIEKISQVKVVLVNQDDALKAYIAAYYTAVEEIDNITIINHLSSVLPGYMIPSFFHQMESIPLNSNGKFDIKKLPVIDKNDVEKNFPENEIEIKLAVIWSQILELNFSNICVDVSFFEVGGHSLNATFLASKIHKDFNVEIPISEIFNSQTIKEQALFISKQTFKKFRKIRRSEKKEYYSLSSAQLQVYLAHNSKVNSSDYNIPVALKLKSESYDYNKLQESLQKLVERHEILRTSFKTIKGNPVQMIHEKVELSISETNDYMQTNNQLLEEFVQPFDLEKPSLFRVQVNQGKNLILFLDFHHIIMDGTSLKLLLKEFIQIYEKGSPDELCLQYRDYTSTIYKIRDERLLEKYEKYWMSCFINGIVLLKFPKRLDQISANEDKRGVRCLTVDKNQIYKIAVKNRTTVYNLLFAVYNIFLSKVCLQKEIIIGIGTSGRSHFDIKEMIGMFVNILPVRNFVHNDWKFTDFLNEITQNLLMLLDYQDYPYINLVKRMRSRNLIKGSRFINAFYEYMYYNNDETSSNKILEFLSDVKPRGVSKSDMDLLVREEKDQIKITLNGNKEIFTDIILDIYISFLKDIIENLIESQDFLIKDIKLQKKIHLPEITIPDNGPTSFNF